jgi:hypothetical protein
MPVFIDSFTHGRMLAFHFGYYAIGIDLNGSRSAFQKLKATCIAHKQGEP